MLYPLSYEGGMCAIGGHKVHPQPAKIVSPRLAGCG